MSDDILKNEEDVKNKVLIPFLGDLGIAADELQYEKSFTIPLGGNKYELGKRSKARGRSDILYKRGNRNIFVVEVKSALHEVNGDDVEQAWSYARLLQPMAVFAIATNGKQTRVIDVHSKIELSGTTIGSQSDFWKRGCKLSLDEELELRYEALRSFIGYSSDNLEAFSRSQVNLRMQTLKGSLKELHKKYIPELCVDRIGITEDFNNFLQGSSTCFALIGESGVGKTNLICSLAENIIKEHVVLFFNAADMLGDIIGNIKTDFNWFFSPHLEAVEIVRRLDKIASRGNYKICILIDAIDEAPALNFALDVNDVVRKLQQYKNIKLCVTCKSLEWRKFLTVRGNPTHLAEAAYKSHATINTDKENDIAVVEPGIHVRRLSDEELLQADNKYRSIFKYRGNLTGETRSECKLPFMLRIVAEVYADRNVPARIDDLDVLSEYLDKKLEKFEKEIGRNFLAEIGNAMISAERNRVADISLSSDKIEESYLRSKLHLMASQKLPDDLFAHNLLTRMESDEGLQFIGFYYTRIRDYVIAILSLKLPSKKGEDFKALLPSLFESSVGRSVISWYVNVAKEDHKKIIIEYGQARAMLFLREYVRIIETHFPIMKDRFAPFTSGKIGLLISHDETDITVAYGFRPLNKADENALVSIPVPIDQSQLFKLDVRGGFKWKSKDFITASPLIAAREEIKEQFKEILTSGALNEDCSVALALEKATAIIHNNVNALGLSKKKTNYWLPDISCLLPLSCAEILKKVKRVRAHEYYWHKAVEAIIKSRTKGKRGTVSVSINTSEVNSYDVEQKTNKALEDDIDIPELWSSRNPNILAVLSNAIKTVQQQYPSITMILLPPPDISQTEVQLRPVRKGHDHDRTSEIIRAQYSDSQLKKYITDFFEIFFMEYKRLIESCFPTLKDNIPFYANLPSGVYVEIIDSEFGAEMRCRYKYSNAEPKIDIVINPSEPLDRFSEDERFRLCQVKRLSSIFLASQPVPYSGLNDSSAGDCPLRNYIYKTIFKDMDVMLQAVDGLN